MGYSDPEKQREFQNGWVKSRREEWLAENGPCVLCNGTDDLEVHHKNPDQKVSHRIWSWTALKREKELAKCVVLCGECHKQESAKQRRMQSPHGTRNRYRKLGCRCARCCEAYQKQENCSVAQNNGNNILHSK